MADLRVVAEAKPWRVIRVPHGDAAGIVDGLGALEADGYALEEISAQANGDVLILGHKEAGPAPAAEEGTPG